MKKRADIKNQKYQKAIHLKYESFSYPEIAKLLKVSEITELRKKLKSAQSNLKVVKNRLAKRSLKDASLEQLASFFDGPTTIAYSETNPVSPAKILVNFIKDRENLVIKGGVLGAEILTLDRIKDLAALPSKEELFAKLLGCMLNPARSMVSVLAAVPRQLVTVLAAIGKQKEM